MPTYEYVCKECSHQFEVFQRMSDDLLKDCPECTQTSLKRLIGTGAGVIFKGTGFYETDFKDKKGSSSKSGTKDSSSTVKDSSQKAVKTDKKEVK